MELKNNNREWPKPNERLSQRAIRGGIWIFSLSIINRLFRLARTIILARVLAPNDFGLMGIALLAMVTLETFSQTGFNAALIQKKGKINEYLDTVWTIQVIRGIVLFGVLLAAAPLVAAFFNTPKATVIVRVIAVSVLLKGFINIGVIYFQKEMEFNKVFIYQLSITVADLAVAIPMALILRSVWALVFGLLAGQFVSCIISYVIHPFRPSIKMDLKKSRELFRFGKWIFGSTILLFLITQGDDIFAGKLLGVTALGLYQMAYMLSNLPATEITHIISRVAFPAYSKLQDDIYKLRNAYLKVLQFTAFLSFPVAGLIFVLAPDFTKIFLGEKWMPMVPAMQVLCIFGMARSFGATTGPLFNGTGNPKILTHLAMLQLLILGAIIFPLTKQWELIGISVAVVIPNIITQLVAACKVIHIIKVRVFNFLIFLLLPLIGTFAMIISILFYNHLSEICLSSFIISIFIGLVTYLALIYLLDLIYESHYKKMVLGLIKSLH